MKRFDILIAVALVLCIAQGAELTITGNSSGTGSRISVVDGVNIQNMTPAEAMYVLGPGHNLNISKTGRITFENGTTYQIIDNQRMI